MPEPELDVAIVGSGPVGCTLALALKGSGLRVALVGHRRESAGQAVVRPIALSYASRLILERIGAWDAFASTPIEQIHVTQAGGFGRTRIGREDVGLPALGYVTGYDDIAAWLSGRVDAATRLPVDAAVPPARLVVHAEGSTAAAVVEKDYDHTAIVARIESERPAHGVAFERFTHEGPLALLPLQGVYGLVWSRTRAAAETSMAVGDEQFLAELQAAFGTRAGHFRSVGQRASNPLVLRHRAPGARAGEVFVGNAAQTLHPVAGQGLNLGLRDAWELARQLRDAPAASIGSTAFAECFSNSRRGDARSTIRATDLLATLFLRTDAITGVLRGAALAGLDVFPPARRVLARRMIYGAPAH